VELVLLVLLVALGGLQHQMLLLVRQGQIKYGFSLDRVGI
jgi:hypothetical protein